MARIILPKLPRPSRKRTIDTAAEMIAFVLDHSAILTAWERGFVESISRARYVLSQKQLKILTRLVTRVRLAEAGSA